MITPEHFIVSFACHDTADFIIDRDGDTILTFADLYMDDVKVDSRLGFQVSSAMLQRESTFFKTHFERTWIPPVNQDGKYHIFLGCKGIDLVGLLIFLLTMHQDFATRSNNLSFLPYAVSMSTLGTIVQLTDFFPDVPSWRARPRPILTLAESSQARRWTVGSAQDNEGADDAVVLCGARLRGS